jgi:hypothetical protein
VYDRMFCSAPGVSVLDTSSIPHFSCDNQKCLQTLPDDSRDGMREQNHPW